ncbi:MAG TPA: hypothetical protein VLF67_00220, partial [Candidatus Saccharimonas sp.]|nr:hypothetical protein [Candidatus Saccharimonas sp.]
NILAGSVICSPNKLFSVPIDLLVGSNALTAIAFNANDEAGPTSNTVNVTLTVPPGGLGFSTELLLVSSSYYRGTTPGTEIDWPAELIGGQAPYAVSFDWGDGHSDLLTRTAAGSFELKHTYSKPGGYLGNYPLIIRATDAAGHTAYLQLVTIVNQPTGQTVVGIKSNIDLVAAWPLWILLVLLWVSFWLGERREKHKLQKQIEALAAT